MLNVLSYGAVGDGSADDTEPIQAALNDAAVNGGWVYIPAGQYRLTGPLTASNNTRVTAHGARLFGQGHRLLTNFHLTDSFGGYTGRSNITVEGGVWDCQGHLAATDDMDNGLGFAHAKNITVRDVTVRNVAGYHGVEVNAIDGALIENCRFEGFTDNSSGKNRGFSEAIQVDVADAGSVAIPLTDGTAARNITIRDCRMGPSDILGPFGALAGSHKIVAGSLYENIKVFGGGCESALSYGIRAAGWVDPIIQGVRLDDVGKHGIWLYDGWNGTVQGNVVRGAGSIGVHIERQNAVMIGGNSVVSPASYGYYLDDNSHTELCGNHCYNAGTAGVKLYGGSTGCLVIANVIRRGSGGATAVACDAGSATTNTISHNRLDGYGTGAGVIAVLSGVVKTSITSTGSIGQNVA